MTTASSSGRVATPSRDWWRPNGSLARWLEGGFALLAAGQILNLLFVSDSARPLVRLHRSFDALFAGDDARAQSLQAHAYDGVNRVPGQLLEVVSLAVTVLLVIWAYRSATNARALGRTGARLAPIWAILGWFIPLAFFVLPYIVVQDLWRSSDPSAARGDGWRSLPGSALVRVWWAAYVVGGAVAMVGIVSALSGVWGLSSTETALRIGAVTAAVGSVLAIVVVRDVTARQAAQQEADPAPTTQAVVAWASGLAADDTPGWKVDPGGRYDHRYWDGSAWTEHVSTAGQPTTAPVTPADWYPDPTGRFHWRYWTGHAWTEHVSRDGDWFVDPVSGAPGTAPGDTIDGGPSSADPPPPA